MDRIWRVADDEGDRQGAVARRRHGRSGEADEVPGTSAVPVLAHVRRADVYAVAAQRSAIVPRKSTFFSGPRPRFRAGAPDVRFRAENLVAPWSLDGQNGS